CSDLNLACGRALADAMADRVFDNRLKTHVGNGCIEDRRIRLYLNLETVLKPDLFNSQVEVQVFKFAAKGHFLHAHIVEHTSQKIAQTPEGLFGFMAPLPAYQHHDGVQRVEQEMRMELRLQRAQLGLCELRLEPQCLLLPFPIIAVVTLRMLNS